jgi:hypothetical protein
MRLKRTVWIGAQGLGYIPQGADGGGHWSSRGALLKPTHAQRTAAATASVDVAIESIRPSRAGVAISAGGTRVHLRGVSGAGFLRGDRRDGTGRDGTILAP